MPQTKKTKRVYTTSQKRPIDKCLMTSRAGDAAVQASFELYDTTFPATITGLRWVGNLTSQLSSSGGGSFNELYWMIVVVRDGLNPNAIAIPTIPSNAVSYAPEQDVLAFGVNTITFESGVAHFEGSTKTMRKLQAGDKIMLVYRFANDTHSCFFNMITQFFMKS